MKSIILPLLAYLVVCLISVFIPASEAYNTVGWKLFIGQIYAIPVLVIAFLISFFVNKKGNQKHI